MVVFESTVQAACSVCIIWCSAKTCFFFFMNNMRYWDYNKYRLSRLVMLLQQLLFPPVASYIMPARDALRNSSLEMYRYNCTEVHVHQTPALQFWVNTGYKSFVTHNRNQLKFKWYPRKTSPEYLFVLCSPFDGQFYVNIRSMHPSMKLKWPLIIP